ncbi:thioredoxin family protein [Ramlibacter sp. RBP-2]|uniref:Thioredoxin family protein n=1 Tax=Ramlibacter lithotrophicus TaxID=2606681 RepID=A0A7X6DJ38_9BURK|nr:thioredoxin family protein [Ramlibacter lithotrophicus]NKE68102.1 thioredoxin family protein [Ramlibacter lithotrophicus]
MVRSLFALVAAFLMLAGASAQSPLPQRFDAARDAAADLGTAVALAREQGKRVLVDVGGEWCSWCHILDRLIETDAQVRQLRDEHYVWLKVNFSPANRNEAVLSRWPKVTGYPHLFVLDERGALLHSQPTGELEAGKGYDREKVLAFLRRHRRP